MRQNTAKHKPGTSAIHKRTRVLFCAYPLYHFRAAATNPRRFPYGACQVPTDGNPRNMQLFRHASSFALLSSNHPARLKQVDALDLSLTPFRMLCYHEYTKMTPPILPTQTTALCAIFSRQLNYIISGLLWQLDFVVFVPTNPVFLRKPRVFSSKGFRK